MVYPIYDILQMLWIGIYKSLKKIIHPQDIFGMDLIDN